MLKLTILKKKKKTLFEKIILINRISKVVKGGRKFRFSALIIVGDFKGKINYAHSKAIEPQEAVLKAHKIAKKNLLFVPLNKDKSFYFNSIGNFGSSKVIIKKAKQGTGLIAGKTIKPILEGLGAQNVITKSLGSRNPYNVIRAVFNAFEKQINYFKLWKI